MKTWKGLHALAAVIFTIAVLTGTGAAPLLALLYGSYFGFFIAAGRSGLRAADVVTLLRVAGTVPLAAMAWTVKSHWPAVAAVLALLELTDLFDGRLARKRGGSRFGAVLDEESDALFTLIIAYLLYSRGGFGGWIMAAGGLRYLFVLLFALLPEEGTRDFPLTFQYFSKAACAVSVVLLICGFGQIFPAMLQRGLPAAAVALLAVSFGWEAALRFKAGLHMPPRGLFTSWLIYYGLPMKQRRMKRLYGRFLGPGGLGFDLGSHLGNRIQAWRALGARVVALEPNPACFRYLQSRYGDEQEVTLLQKAVGGQQGEGVLHIDPRNPTLATLSRDWIGDVSSSRAFRGIRWSSTCPVRVVTLDELICRYGRPDFCKIDVEGFEHEVLYGLSEPLPALSFEYLSQGIDRAKRCLDRLQELGEYEFRISRRETMRFIGERWLSADEVRRFLDGLRDGDSAGDIYARLRQ